MGTPVLCPLDGKIHGALLGYRNSWSCSSVGFAQQTGNYEQDSLIFIDWEMTQEQIHNTSLSIGVKTTDGKVVWIDGIRPTRLFKTGEMLHRGDTLGTVGYLYKKIKQPCIGIVISKNSKPDDPMTPFGIKTTFIPPKVNNKTQLTREEAQADIDGMMAALEDAFTGLYDYTPKEEFNTFIKETEKWCQFEAHFGACRLVQRHATHLARCPKIQGISRQGSDFHQWRLCRLVESLAVRVLRLY